MHGNQVCKYINEAVSAEMVLIVTVCNVYFSLVNLGRSLLDMDTFSKSDPGKLIIFDPSVFNEILQGNQSTQTKYKCIAHQ